MNQASPLPKAGIGGQTGRVHPLIEVPALDRLLRRQTPVILLDARWHLAGPPGIESYRKGHLPGAAFIDLDRDVAGPPGPGGRHPLPDPVEFESAMRRAGVSQDSLVVVYDDADSTSAARVWWSLRYFGHDRVRVLDGGYRAWTEAGHRVSTAEPEVKPGGFIANPGRLPVLDAEGAAELATAGVLLDARAAERYRGEQEPVDPVAGHIPGARNAPTSGNVGVDGRFLPPGLLRERFAKLGATDALDVGAYCGSGVTAAHEILALNLAGIPAALYVGSWSDWVTDPANPVATGDN
jgi:thiosulfate/3-mercaptopyruvate sulfurtransferase